MGEIEVVKTEESEESIDIEEKGKLKLNYREH